MLTVRLAVGLGCDRKALHFVRASCHRVGHVVTNAMALARELIDSITHPAARFVVPFRGAFAERSR